MLIYDLVSFCDEEYKNSDCFPCTAKTICKGNCGQHCKECLDDIHYHEHQYRDEYDCERLLDYYVCRYSYKYCSEMIYALRQKDLLRYPYFHILSLGCGGAPDLMALNIWIMNNQYHILAWIKTSIGVRFTIILKIILEMV